MDGRQLWWVLSAILHEVPCRSNLSTTDQKRYDYLVSLERSALVRLRATVEQISHKAGEDKHFAVNHLTVAWALGKPGTISSVARPPGSRLRAFAGFFYSAKTVSQVFEETLTDLQNEYCQALAQGSRWKARWVRLRGYWSFWNAALAHLLVSVLDNFVKIWKLTR